MVSGFEVRGEPAQWETESGTSVPAEVRLVLVEIEKRLTGVVVPDATNSVEGCRSLGRGRHEVVYAVQRDAGRMRISVGPLLSEFAVSALGAKSEGRSALCHSKAGGDVVARV